MNRIRNIASSDQNRQDSKSCSSCKSCLARQRCALPESADQGQHRTGRDESKAKRRGRDSTGNLRIAKEHWVPKESGGQHCVHSMDRKQSNPMLRSKVLERMRWFVLAVEAEHRGHGTTDDAYK